MNPIINAVRYYSKRAREKWAAIFRATFHFDEHTKILDLGSENGSMINSVLAGSKVRPKNVYITDIDAKLIAEGQRKFGYDPVLVDEPDRLPFEDGLFDVVFCSSFIEHITVS
ncbi:MAG: methyltransferase domain-containing protein [Deferribacteres bacterium]|nr:methyltransferase domain-containing protein [Deferribacteres bacterium]